ncbi:hypothetical protein CEUSTIGMA_g7183.t1 [Chlamydomonas eustigma]|uniref:Uncharacterized protein n=1 Tax=Chlamydomonas eustigma TaxID=1157962 RepID=A0A250XA57_9CHLO|nr:hypothetical protein CEUSTIGMA_g7183.t1 [Chlamydomonas eustigma]|eukprot:GAX79742.1 hypothetical protein CEUSTIGMA_g7183.t1 [Chlamydomonas eustigma]
MLSCITMNQVLNRSLYCISPGLGRGLSFAHSQEVSNLYTSNIFATLRKALHSDASDGLSSGLSTHAASTCFEASSSLEPLLMMFAPSQIGAQLLNQVHSATGLPWWASIPLATLAVRAALLPLSIRAKASSTNLILINEALAKARQIRDKIKSSSLPDGSSLSSTARDDKAVKDIGMWSLARGTYLHLRTQHSVPSLRWYILNAITQTCVFTTITTSLSRMSSSMWPGFATEGLPGLTDLTSPALFLQTLSTPYGTLGAILPLGLVLLYTSSTDLTAGARVPGILAALRIMAIPYYCISLLQPQAVLLYWATVSLSHYALQLMLSTSSGAKWARLPTLMTGANISTSLPQQRSTLGGTATSNLPEHHRDHYEAATGEESTASSSADIQHVGRSTKIGVELSPASPRADTAANVGGPALSSLSKQDSELLVFLGQRYSKTKNPDAAIACYRLALQITDGDCKGAVNGLKSLRLGI